MGLGATIVGTAYGVSTMLITNAMRKTALFQRPWEVVIAGGVGAFVANQAMDFEHFLEVRVQEMARDRILNNKEVMEEEYRQILGPRFDKWFPEVRPATPDYRAARPRRRRRRPSGSKLVAKSPPAALAGGGGGETKASNADAHAPRGGGRADRRGASVNGTCANRRAGALRGLGAGSTQEPRAPREPDAEASARLTTHIQPTFEVCQQPTV